MRAARPRSERLIRTIALRILTPTYCDSATTPVQLLAFLKRLRGPLSLAATLVLSNDSRVMQTITRYLDILRGTVDGDDLHGLIARTLRRHSQPGPPGLECLADLFRELDSYARDPVSAPRMRIRARLLQQHIAPYLSELDRARTPDSRASPAAVERPVPAAATAADGSSVEGVLERPGERAEAEERHRSERYEALQRSENDAWQAIYGTVQDYRRLKDAWQRSLEELAHERETLERKLRKTTEELGRLEAENERLRSALERPHPDGTGAPHYVESLPRLLARINSGRRPLARREAFVEQVQAEIKRIKRSGAPLALGLIGVQSLDLLSQRYGEEAAAAALRCYAEEVLSNFRAYDLVALYDRDQFAVMFPDTNKEGARRALEKAYKRAVETHLNHAGTSIPLPPFAGALVTYSPGEDPAAFLGRVSKALDDVRTRGQRGIVLS